MAAWGASLEELNRLSNALGAGATTLENDVHNSLRPLVENCPWSGPDADRFRQNWAGMLAPSILKAARALEDAASHILQQLREQEQASSATGIGTPGSATGIGTPGSAAGIGTPGSTGGPTPLGLGAGNAFGNTPLTEHAPDTPATQAAASAFVSQWQGKIIDADGHYGAQCFDVFRQYNRDVVGAPDSVASGKYSSKAADIFQQYERNEAANYYDRIPKGAGDPQPGDIVVFGTGMGGGYGHVGLVAEAGGGKLGVLEQNYLVYQGKNWSNPTDPAKVNPYDMDNRHILGYLRPKQVK